MNNYADFLREWAKYGAPKTPVAEAVLALLDENAALRAQLRKYGRHLSECVFNQPWDDDDPALCTCGFIEHLREILGDAS